MVIYAEKTRDWWQLAVLVGYGVVVALATYAVFSASGRIARALGQTGIDIMTRLMGFDPRGAARSSCSLTVCKSCCPILANSIR